MNIFLNHNSNFLHMSKSLENMLEVHHQGRRKGQSTHPHCSKSGKHQILIATSRKIEQQTISGRQNEQSSKGHTMADVLDLCCHHGGSLENPIVLRVSSSQWRGCPRFSPHISTSWWLEKCNECSTQADHTVDLPLWLSALLSKVFLDMWKNCSVSKLLLSESTTSWSWLEQI